MGGWERTVEVVDFGGLFQVFFWRGRAGFGGFGWRRYGDELGRGVRRRDLVPGGVNMAWSEVVQTVAGGYRQRGWLAGDLAGLAGRLRGGFLLGRFTVFTSFTAFYAGF
ncbi:hypothetical protein QQ045_014225 [Rhodiola kirilowii]